MARNPIRLARGFLTVGAWTLLSRIAGFARDVMMAAYLGAGPAAEAFLVAFSLPNMFRRFFAEGAFNMAFVPLFAKKVEGDEDARGFAEDAFAALSAFLVVFTVLGTLLMPWLVLAMAAGFRGDERFDLAVLYGRIGFVYILFISLVALLSGILNTFGRFTEATIVPVLMNLMFIAAMWIADLAGWDMGLTLAWTVPVTGVAQLAFTWWMAARAGWAPRLRMPRLTPELRHLAVVAAPALLAGGVVQVNLLVGRQVASFFEGAVAWLSYADRLYQLPLGVVGIAIGTVLLPDLSRRLRAGDAEGGRHAFNRATEIGLALTIPAAVALVVIAQPLILALFERGAFGRADTVATAATLAVYGAGLPAFVLHKVLQPLFYAREDTASPFRFAVWSMVVNAAVAVGCAPLIEGVAPGWGFLAAALGTTVAGWTMAWQLWRGARGGMGEAARADDRLRARLPRILLASLLMGAVLWVVAGMLEGALTGGGPTRWGALAALVALGLGVYGAAGWALGAFRPADLRAALRR
ncbi:murein biosynthesis integral membrane protein MurJ [Rubellimicrobium sp. CFH 75288]|uniref:murein biosynthesis integral membrane protein MurJ n=1 Tax=Rubellimicrobium sp. CFH 75288 TaxID=2697034 RepID=UPI0014127361|nr:murein biosynthesis integral membrane protein MurJ [Rubellimicrobium sp. CFH 75288]NAZ36620.1 murein biosynthesis integral membrane protein MurJ [Rubellimicrobium sp. CFH 75288]